MPIELTEDMVSQIDHARENGVPCLLGTSSGSGTPDIAIRGSVLVYDHEHLAFWERSRNESLANMEDNPNVVVYFRNPATRAQWRFFGEAKILKPGDEVRDNIMARIVKPELDADPQRLGFGVLVRVDRVRQNNNVLMERDTEEERVVIDAILQMEDLIEQANRESDASKFDAILAPDFRFKGGGSASISRREFMATLSGSSAWALARHSPAGKEAAAKTAERAVKNGRGTILLLNGGLRVGESNEYNIEVHSDDIALVNRRYAIEEPEEGERDRCLRYMRVYKRNGETWQLLTHSYVHAVD